MIGSNIQEKIQHWCLHDLKYEELSTDGKTQASERQLDVTYLHLIN